MHEMLSKDRRYMWHPYTQMKELEKEPPVFIKKAKGLRLYDEKGKSYIDAISSWWCNLHGHNHPEIISAIKKQVEDLDHVLFAGFTHSPAVELAEKLVEISPQGLNKVFFSDNGSTAVETALKMSLQYRKNTGAENKTYFAAIDKGYHGDTCGAMSVGGENIFNQKFKQMLFPTFKIPTPECYRCPCEKKRKSCSFECIEMAKDVLEENSEKITALILEPLVMGAGGMIIYPKEYLYAMRRITKKLDIHLIADEVATGFTRTGKLFACEHVKISPDFMCLSKSLTSGTMALSATLTTDDVYSNFYDDKEKLKTFYHGHTYSANPIACSAANMTLDLIEKTDYENIALNVNKKISEFLEEMSKTSFIGDTRSLGLIGAMELVRDKETKAPFDIKDRLTYNIARAALEEGLVIRPLGDVLYFFLPLCVNKRDMELIFDATRKAFKKAGAL